MNQTKNLDEIFEENGCNPKLLEKVLSPDGKQWNQYERLLKSIEQYKSQPTAIPASLEKMLEEEFPLPEINTSLLDNRHLLKEKYVIELRRKMATKFYLAAQQSPQTESQGKKPSDEEIGLQFPYPTERNEPERKAMYNRRKGAKWVRDTFPQQQKVIGDIKSPEELLKTFHITPETKYHNYDYLYNSAIKLAEEYHAQFPQPSNQIDWEIISRDFYNKFANQITLFVGAASINTHPDAIINWFKSRPEFLSEEQTKNK